MNIREKCHLFILTEMSGQAAKGINRNDVDAEYKYALKELTSDGYLNEEYLVDDKGENQLKGYQMSDRGRMRCRMLLEKWEEERA